MTEPKPAAANPLAVNPSAPGASALNPTAASLLGFLHDGPLTGWELVSTVQRAIGPFWSLTRSQVYRELSSLDAAGFIEAGPVGRRDARPYTLTDRGREAFAAWVARGPGEASMRLPLLLFVTLGRHIPSATLLGILGRQRSQQAQLLKIYLGYRGEAQAAGADVLQLAPLEYGIATARATVRWLDGLLAALGDSPPTAPDAGGGEGGDSRTGDQASIDPEVEP